MDRADFRAGIVDAINDMRDPNGEYANLIREGNEIVAELNEHDPGLGARMHAVVTAIESLGVYIRSRGADEVPTSVEGRRTVRP